MQVSPPCCAFYESPMRELTSSSLLRRFVFAPADGNRTVEARQRQ